MSRSYEGKMKELPHRKKAAYAKVKKNGQIVSYGSGR